MAKKTVQNILICHFANTIFEPLRNRNFIELIIHFKEVPYSLFADIELGAITSNRLILGIQPEEKMTLTFQTKNPGATVCLREVTMDFHYYHNFQGPSWTPMKNLSSTLCREIRCSSGGRTASKFAGPFSAL